MDTLASHDIATPITHSSARATVTPAKLIRWGGIASMLTGALTIVANLLHPPRSFATLVHDAHHTTWEIVHVLAIVAFVVGAFTIVALYAVQIERVGMIGLIGFAGTLGGIILSVGLLVPDSLIFPVLARDPDVAHLLSFPGPLIGDSLFTIYMALSGATYCLGTVVFFGASARAGVLPRWGSLLVAIGIVPLAFGALVWQGIDYLGAIIVGLGYVSLGYALWTGSYAPDAQPARPTSDTRQGGA
jgi:hypothetical protein